MGKAQFTVIVPTRERPDTLIHCLRTLVAQDYDNLTILVSDNFSQDETRDVVATLRDPRIRYINTGRRVGMSQNWEFALRHVESGWVNFRGDDDGLLPGAITSLNNLINDFPCEAVNSPYCTYFWPNNGWSRGASLAVPTKKENVRYLDSRVELAAVMKGESYTRLPWLYQGGFATIDAVNRAKSPSGSFFLSRTPDVYSGIALSSVTDKFLRIETPLAIAGASRHSTGISATNSAHQGTSWSKYLSEEDIPFHSALIFGKSPPLLVYECYLQSHFLHEDFLGIQLRDQLDLALVERGMLSSDVVYEQCAQIAAMNNVRLKRSSVAAFVKLAKAKAFQQARRFANVPNRKLLLGEEEAGSNVFEASVKAKEVCAIAELTSSFANAAKNIASELKPKAIARRLLPARC